MKEDIPRGFTITELIAVIVITATLAVIAVPIMSGYIEKTKGAKAVYNLRIICQSAKMCYADTGNVDTGLLIDMAAINSFYRIQITDTDFRYEGSQMNETYGFTATRVSGPYGEAFIYMDQDGYNNTSTWPFRYEQ